MAPAIPNLMICGIPRRSLVCATLGPGVRGAPPFSQAARLMPVVPRDSLYREV